MPLPTSAEFMIRTANEEAIKVEASGSFHGDTFIWLPHEGNDDLRAGITLDWKELKMLSTFLAYIIENEDEDDD